MEAGLLVFLLFSAVAASAAPTQDDSSVRIIGGTPVSPGELPFIVSIQITAAGKDNRHHCGGTLINMSRVITAASCLTPPIPGSYVVSAGATTMDEVLKGHMQARNVRSISIHPDYNMTSIHNDLAVLDLTSAFIESAGVAPLRMASRSLQDYPDTCVIAGWGATDGSQLASDVLRKATIKIYPKAQCERYHGDKYRASTEICGYGQGQNGDIAESCDSDKGGPLICESSDGNSYLAGVVGWRNPSCFVQDKPGIYMEVAKYRSWLDKFLPGGGHDQSTTPSPTSSTVAATSQPSTQKAVGAEERWFDSAEKGC